MSKESLAKMFLARLSAREHPDAIRNVKYYYELRQQRLEKYGLTVTSLFSPDGSIDSRELARWEDDHYTETCFINSGNIDTSVKKDGKVLYKDKDNKFLYTSVTDSKGADLVKDDVYCCPNCGAVSTLDQLLSGCSYCDTRFEMSDLFPKVSLNYSVKDISRTRETARSEIMKFIVPFALIFLVINAVKWLSSADRSILDAIWSVFILSILGGCLLGYFTWAMSMLGTVFGMAAKSASMLPALSSDKKFTKFMSKYSPEFSFEHFRGELISMLEILIFSDRDTDLPFYTGKENDLFEDVIDSSYRGAVKLEKYSVKDNICTLSATAFLENLHYSGGKIRKKNDQVHLTLEKDLNCEVRFPFGIHVVKCRSCGGSFDTYRTKTCPYCGTPYQAKDLGWTIKEFHIAD